MEDNELLAMAYKESLIKHIEMYEDQIAGLRVNLTRTSAQLASANEEMVRLNAEITRLSAPVEQDDSVSPEDDS